MRRNLRRAGRLPKRSDTVTDVPPAAPWAPEWVKVPHFRCTVCPASASEQRVVRVRSETAAILGRASPRNPRVLMDSNCAWLSSLLVAWRWKANSTWSTGMPWPSSVMRICWTPPPWISTVIWDAPASREFSTNSLTADAGRSTTSPAAILLARSGGSTLIGMAWP